MRPFLSLAVATLSLAALAPDAEARAGRGVFRSIYTVRAAEAPPVRPAADTARQRTIVAPVMAGSAAGASAATASSPAPANILLASAEADAGPVPTVTSQPAWCPSNRVAGSGRGFCEIN